MVNIILFPEWNDLWASVCGFWVVRIWVISITRAPCGSENLFRKLIFWNLSPSFHKPAEERLNPATQHRNKSGCTVAYFGVRGHDREVLGRIESDSAGPGAANQILKWKIRKGSNYLFEHPNDDDKPFPACIIESYQVTIFRRMKSILWYINSPDWQLFTNFTVLWAFCFCLLNPILGKGTKKRPFL